jgi:succinate dehydrogenase / fumarate reductase iron-sulfur subunit
LQGPTEPRLHTDTPEPQTEWEAEPEDRLVDGLHECILCLLTSCPSYCGITHKYLGLASLLHAHHRWARFAFAQHPITDVHAKIPKLEPDRESAPSQVCPMGLEPGQGDRQIKEQV